MRLAREIWQDHYLPIIGQAQIDYMLGTFQSAEAISAQIATGHEYYLVRYRGQDVGYLAVVADDDGAVLKIGKIYVRRAERGRGVGKAMLVFVEDLCRQRRIGRIWLTVNRNNSHSIDWYSRMGFRKTGAVIQDIGGGFVMDDFQFEKVL